MSIEEVDDSIVDIISWLSGYSITTVVIITSDWFNPDGCKKALETLTQISNDPHYKNEVAFRLFSADQKAEYCKCLSVARTPTVIIFKNGKEVARFSDSTSKVAIIHQLSILTNPTKNHPRIRPVGTVTGHSEFHPG